MSGIKQEIRSQFATNCSQLKVPVSNSRRMRLSEIYGQLPQTASNSSNCPVIPDSSRVINNGEVAILGRFGRTIRGWRLIDF